MDNPLFLQDTNPNVVAHVMSVMNEAKKEKYLNRKLEKAREEKRYKKEEGQQIARRVTVQEVMSEQQMFQEEHLKLLQEHHLLKKEVIKMQTQIALLERGLRLVSTTLEQHLCLRTGLDRSGSTEDLASDVGTSSAQIHITPSLGSQKDEICTCCNKEIKDCKCFDYCWDCTRPTNSSMGTFFQRYRIFVWMVLVLPVEAEETWA